MERLEEVIGEVEKQINTLKRQASKARRYRALSEEIKGLEAVLLADKWRAARTALDQSKTDLANATRALEDSVTQEAGTSAAEAEAHAKIDPLRSAEAEAAGRLGALKLELATLDGERKAANDALTRLTADLDRVVGDLSREHDLRDEADRKASQAQTDLDALPPDDEEARVQTEDAAKTTLLEARQRPARARTRARCEDADCGCRRRRSARGQRCVGSRRDPP